MARLTPEGAFLTSTLHMAGSIAGLRMVTLPGVAEPGQSGSFSHCSSTNVGHAWFRSSSRNSAV